MIAPALATTPEQDALFKAERERVAARVTERNAAFARENARRKALCERIGGVRIGLNTEGVLKSCWGQARQGERDHHDHPQPRTMGL